MQPCGSQTPALYIITHRRILALYLYIHLEISSKKLLWAQEGAAKVLYLVFICPSSHCPLSPFLSSLHCFCFAVGIFNDFSPFQPSFFFPPHVGVLSGTAHCLLFLFLKAINEIFAGVVQLHLAFGGKDSLFFSSRSSPLIFSVLFCISFSLSNV